MFLLYMEVLYFMNTCSEHGCKMIAIYRVELNGQILYMCKYHKNHTIHNRGGILIEQSKSNS
jgi:hypothetical protein